MPVITTGPTVVSAPVTAPVDNSTNVYANRRTIISSGRQTVNEEPSQGSLHNALKRFGR